MSLLKDINPGTGGSGAFNFSEVGAGNAILNGSLFFPAYEATNGWGLWKTDGTPEGTVLVKDIIPNNVPVAQEGEGTFIHELFIAGDNIFFIANDGIHGNELWKSNGTDAGTVLVKDIAAGIDSSEPDNFTTFGGTLFFTAYESVHGRELWKSDGTEAGTVLVKDINSGNASAAPGELTPSDDGTLYFEADDGVHGIELWKTDGSDAGTVMINDIFTGASSSNPGHFMSVGGTLFFLAMDDIHHGGLWKSDGTGAGTVMLRDLQVHSSNAFPFVDMIDVNGTLYFASPGGVGDEQLWKSDGTPNGTKLVASLGHYIWGVTVAYMTNVNGAIYIVTNQVDNSTLWKSNGTAAGTVKLHQFESSPWDEDQTDFFPFISAGNTVYYIERLEQNDLLSDNMALWKTEGTARTTSLVTTFEAVPNGWVLPKFYKENNTAYCVVEFYVGDTEYAAPTQFWKLSSTGSGLVRVDDFDLYNVEGLSYINGSLIFAADDHSTYGYELWTATTPPEIPEATIAFSQSSLSVDENAGTIAATVKLSKASPLDVSVHYTTTDDQALAGSDYTATTGTLTIPAGQTTGTIQIPITNDDVIEQAEAFTLQLSSPTNALLGSNTLATITIEPSDANFISLSKTTRTQASFNDHDGQKVTLKLTGPGSVDAFGLFGEDLQFITLNDTTVKSSLSISVAGKDGSTSVQTITVHGSLGNLLAPATTLTELLDITGSAKNVTLAEATGQIDVGAPGDPLKDKLTLKLGLVRELSITSNTALANLRVLDWQDDDDTLDVVQAPWMGALSVSGRKARGLVTALAGDFEADLILSGENAPKGVALNSAAVAGAIHQSNWTLVGHVGSITADSMIDSAVDMGRTNNPQNIKYNLGTLTLKLVKNIVDPDFLRSRVHLTGTLKSANLSRTTVAQNVIDADAIAGKQLGVTADRITSLALLIPDTNSGKPVKLKQIDTLADLVDAKKNPSQIAWPVDQFHIKLL